MTTQTNEKKWRWVAAGGVSLFLASLKVARLVTGRKCRVQSPNYIVIVYKMYYFIPFVQYTRNRGIFHLVVVIGNYAMCVLTGQSNWDSGVTLLNKACPQAVSPPPMMCFDVLQLWVAPPFSLCISLWDINSTKIAQEKKEKKNSSLD